MKTISKLILVVALTLSTSSLFAQKMGSINMQELLMVMPETAEMQTNLEAFRADLADNLETMNVELNTKFADYQKNLSTMTDSVRGLKEKELQDLQTRMQQFEQSAMQEMQAKQQQLLEPIIAKARDAVNNVAKSEGYAVVYDLSAGSLAYYDPATVIDVTPSVKTSLGIDPNAVPTAPAPAAAPIQ